jgi:flagellar hook assembly protein FlgD
VDDDAVASNGLDLRLGANPTSGHVRLVLSLSQSAEARVEVFDIVGRRVRVLADGWRSAGEHPLVWDGRTDMGVPAATGMYFVSARSEGWGLMKRLVFIR